MGDSQYWYVYILKCHDDATYVGCSSNLRQRLEAHNNGQVFSTKNKLPVELIVAISFKNKHKAYAFEKYLKSGSGRAFMNKHFL